MEEQMGLWWLVTQGALYISGAIIYAVSAPDISDVEFFSIF